MKSMKSVSPTQAAADRQQNLSPRWQNALVAFGEFQIQHRGLSPGSVDGLVRVLRRFAAYASSKGAVAPEQVTAIHIDDFVVDHARIHGQKSAPYATSSLRVFLRYLALEGQVAAELATQVPSPRTYTLAGLPPTIDWDAVLRVISAAPRRDAADRREYALLMLLATYGMRAGDAAGLLLDDLHWREAKITFRMQKTGRYLALPLIDPVADALVDYIRRDRAPCEFRQVFLTLHPPFHPLARRRITLLVRKAFVRSGVETRRGMAAHAFRHSLATRLVRHGVKLKTVADCLGHATTESTYLYTKLAVEDLRTVALDPREVLR